MLQAYAATLGYSFATRRRERVTWDKHDGIGIAVYRTNHASVLKQERTRMIVDGEIDIGTAICPTEATKIGYDPQTNAVVKKVTEVYGRKISIQKIRTDHLKLMRRKGLLRETDVFSIGNDELKGILQKYKGMLDNYTVDMKETSMSISGIRNADLIY